MTEDRFAPLKNFVTYTTLAIILFSALLLGANRPVSWSLLSFFVLGTFALQLLYTSLSPPAPILQKAMAPTILYLVVVAWGGVQLIGDMPEALAHPYWAFVPEAAAHISADPGQGVHIVMRYLAYGMIFWIIAAAAISPMIAARLLRMIALFSTALALFGLYAFVTGNNFILAEATNSGTVQASFINRNSYATYAIFGALANIAAYLQIAKNVRGGQEGWLARVRDTLEGFYGGAWLYAFGALICIGAVSLTQSRAGALAGIVGILVFIRAWQGRKRKFDWVMWAVFAAVLTFIAFTSATGTARRFLTTTDEDGRFAVFPSIVDGIMDRPLLGHGLGAFHDAFRPYIPPNASFGEWLRAHNSYLENAFEMGLPAALAFYAALGLILWRIRRGARERRQQRVFPVFALSCGAAAGVHALLDFSLQMPASAALFAVILAIGFAQSFRKEEIKQKRN